MGTHNSPAYRDGIADHQRRNAALSECPPRDLDLCQPGKWGGPWMYLKGWGEVADVEPHSCKRCNGQQTGAGGDGAGSVEVSGTVDMWA